MCMLSCFVIKVSARSFTFHQRNMRACSSPVGGTQTPFDAAVFFFPAARSFGKIAECGGHILGSDGKVSNGVHIRASGSKASPEV